ncbi:Hsp90-like protein [Pleurostoma richardsiae]|uniref:Hsp90-like protein n=1 Tax=Pleurostoma richardsiae TaxID=41990 RepID=A0AA38R2X1_9PEZI|nr:Hsp90-like protein [Pleurostoma richardsiae]
MLSRLRDDKEEVTTLKLARGHVGTASPSRSASTPQSRGSDRSSNLGRQSRTPDGPPLPSQLQPLQGVGVIELLEQDERPTFIIDLAEQGNFGPGPLHLLFCNASLRASRTVLDLLALDTENTQTGTDFSRFKAWCVSFVRNSESVDVCLPSLSYAGISWTCSTVRRRFRFISGNGAAVSITPTSPTPLAQASSVLDQRARGPTPMRDPPTPRERAASEVDYFGNVDPELHRRARSEPRDPAALRPAATPGSEGSEDDDLSMDFAAPCFDWTRITMSALLPPHIQFARSIDWSLTSLGPIEEWPVDLRAMSNLIMASPHPAAMYWGPEYVAIYNKAYITLAGQKHPGLMGSSYIDSWAEIWADMAPIFDSAWNSGQAMMKHDDRLFIFRNGFLEETFFDWAIVPLVGSDGTVVALYNPAFENTRRKVNERRMFTLREVGEKTATARDVRSFWLQVLKGLEFNEYDIPFAMIYSVTEDSGSEVSSMHSGSLANPPQILLEGSLGVPADHPAAVSSIDLRMSEEGFAPFMRQAMSLGGEPVVLTKEADTLPESLLEGIQCRGFGDPCRTVVVFPVHPTTAGESVVGFIIMGVNPRRPYNDDYRLFINLLSRQLANSLASVVLFEEEIRRGQKAAQRAALDRQELSLQLRLRTQEAVESEYKFTRMAEFAPVGIFIANHEGKINFCNESWWEISRHPRSADTIDTWMESVREEDRAAVEAAWRQLVVEKLPITHEFRFKCFRETNGHPIDTWVLMSAYPEKDETGAIKSIFGCITDISQQKWAEVFQNQRREEAVEVKRQQDNFIDITSHEMRNPLSAIIQCTDEIMNGVMAYRAHSDPTAPGSDSLNSLLDSCLEAASTISLCANHQKRIVDDILTLSKLDSQLLLVTPVDVQPAAVVEEVFKMFEIELNTNDIQGEFRIDKSYQELEIDWVKLDPSRLRQVLINLMTNAIKFTQNREKRSIYITLGASEQVPPPKNSGVFYFPVRQEDLNDPTDKPGWGTGDKISLTISVTDTGPGLDEKERNVLFQRFSQATPRTHVQYGGSGLGLFISRSLTELQGGQIGVDSRKGVGSTFAFYVRARKTGPPLLLTPTTMMPPPVIAPPAQTAVQRVQYTTNRAGGHGSPPQLSQRSSIPPSPRQPGAPPALDVLIVEDNLVNQSVLQRQLRRSGNNTYVANHGGEALEALQRSRFWSQAADPSRRPVLRHGSSAGSHASDEETNINISVILMDLEMPVMDGMTCARKIRELERDGVITSHVPIIAVTAYARPEQIESAKAAGIDDVISKPFRIPELLPKIEELVAKYETHSISSSPAPA